MTVIYDVFKVSVEQQARNTSLLKKALRARSKRACLLIAVFLVILVAVNCVIASILVRKAGLIDNIEERLREMEKKQVQNKFGERIHEIEQKLLTVRDFQKELKK